MCSCPARGWNVCYSVHPSDLVQLRTGMKDSVIDRSGDTLPYLLFFFPFIFLSFALVLTCVTNSFNDTKSLSLFTGGTAHKHTQVRTLGYARLALHVRLSDRSYRYHHRTAPAPPQPNPLPLHRLPALPSLRCVHCGPENDGEVR